MTDIIDIDLPDFEIVDPPPGPSARVGFSMRPYQGQAVEAFWEGVDARDEHAPNGYKKQLIVLPTGCGKTIVFSEITRIAVTRGWKVLILAHTDELLEQAADKLRRSTGLESEKEKAQDVASASANVVVASVQTLRRASRLSGWAQEHFQLIIVDEAHRSLAQGYQDVLAHFAGAWVLGVTATPDRGDKRSLGEFFDRIAFSYGLLDAVLDGWLVRPVARLIPLEIDLRGIRTRRTSEGSDLDLGELSHRLEPLLREIAKHVAVEARMRKTVIFTPSVETARILTTALREYGMEASFVSGACDDRAEKIAAFHRAGANTAICNAMLLTEGWDCADVSCVVNLRLTKIRSLFAQMVGRGTRPLPGLVDNVNSAEARKAAIAASAKSNLLILDFLWITEKLDLVRPAHLVADREAVAEKMTVEAGVDVDLIDQKEQAERDLLASLEKTVRENAKKKRRTIDPLSFAVSVHDEALVDYQPTAKWELDPPTAGQLARLDEAGIDVSKVACRGQASKLIEQLNRRMELGLCTPKQMAFLTNHGHPDPEFVKFEEAQRLIGRRMAELTQRREEEKAMRARDRVRAGVRAVMQAAEDGQLIERLRDLEPHWAESRTNFPTGWPAVVAMLENHTNPAVAMALLPFRTSHV